MEKIDQVKEIEDFLSGKKNVWSWFFDNPFIGIAICNHKCELISVNNAHYHISGIPREQCLGSSMVEYEKTGVVDHAITPLVIKNKQTILSEQNTPSKRFIVQGKPILNEQGEVRYVVNLLFDVTLQNQLQRLLEKKDDKDDLIILKKMEEWQSLFDNVKEKSETEEKNLVFQSKVMEAIMRLIDQISHSDAPVLITGESGVGKELIAREIYKRSDRKNNSFISINCGAIPEALLESELFGYEPGAFTSSNPKGKKGLFEMANGGTLFLDEIGELSYPLQAKLLRVLQEKVFRKVGGTQDMSCDFRILSATNANLISMMEEKKFRKDLYYRLNVIPIHVPPLSERREDILILSCYFLNYYCKKYNTAKQFDVTVLDRLMHLKFEGNVRELQNLIERLVLLSQNEVISNHDINLVYKGRGNKDMCGEFQEIFYEQGTYKEMMEQFEKKLLTHFNQKYKSSYKLAEELALSQTTMWRKLQKHGLSCK